MSAVDSPRAVPYLAGGPEAIFRVGDVGGTSAGATGGMDTGPWCRDADGTPAPGTLGVLVDVVWGGAAVACAPAGMWGATTELTVSFAAALPWDGSRLQATGRVVHRSPHAALAVGSVQGADGETIAAGSQRTRFAGGAPAPHPSRSPPSPVPAGEGVEDLLGLRAGPGPGPGTGELELPATSALANPAGNVHGGILFCVAELAAARALGAREAGLTAELLSILYLRPARIGDVIRCEADVVRRGRTSATAIVRCVGADGQPRALATLQYGPVETANP